jgi:MFS family permease
MAEGEPDADPSPSMPWGFVAAMSTAQVVSWGSLFYAFALFLDPMSRELGWSKPQLTAGYSLGLVAWGLGAYPVGRAIDRGGGRLVMTLGSATATALLLVWSQVSHYAVFIALWIGLGFVMSATLYEPGFAVLARRLGPKARRGITAMTLVGGFASTVFIPLTHLFIEQWGWRGALVGLAVLNAVLGVAIHVWAIPKEAPPSPAAPTATPLATASGGARRVFKLPAFWGFVAVSIIHGAIFTGFSVHLIPLLVERGSSLDGAVAAFMLIGPAQVAARIVIAATERVVSVRVVGLVTTLIPVAAFVLLFAVETGSWLLFAFTLLYGAANGMMTIVRAVLPMEIFGRDDYGAIQGLISAPATLSKAASPFLFGVVWAIGSSYGPVQWLALGGAVASAACFAILVLPQRRV